MFRGYLLGRSNFRARRPLTRRLRGGKGVATAGGGAIVLFPIAAYVSAYFSLSPNGKTSLGSITIAPLASVDIRFWSISRNAFTVGLSVLIILRHYQAFSDYFLVLSLLLRVSKEIF